MPGYADQSRGPARRLLLLPYTTTTHRQHQQTVSSTSPLSTYLAAESFSEAGKVLGGRWCSQKRKARYCVGPGAPAYDWKCPSRARSEAPPAHYVVLCGAVRCIVVLCGALWCSVVPEPTLLCRRLPPSMPLCVQWNLRAFCRNWLWNSLRIIAYKTEGQMEYLYTAQVEIRHCLWIDFHLREVKRALWLRRNSVKVWSCSCVPNSSLWGATKQPAQPAQPAQQYCTDLPIYRCKQELNL